MTLRYHDFFLMDNCLISGCTAQCGLHVFFSFTGVYFHVIFVTNIRLYGLASTAIGSPCKLLS